MTITNVSFNYTITATVGNIASLSYYPLIFLVLLILPLIVLIITLSINISNRTRMLILFFNIIYLLLLPSILIFIMGDFELKFYIYEVILNNNYLTTYFSIISSDLAGVYSFAIYVAIIFIIISSAIFYYYRFKEAYSCLKKKYIPILLIVDIILPIGVATIYAYIFHANWMDVFRIVSTYTSILIAILIVML
jgi:hypothetical protein